MEFLHSWDSLVYEDIVDSGAPHEYVLYSLSTSLNGHIRSPFKDDRLSVIATIGQRDADGRLFKNGRSHIPFAPRKFTVLAKHAERHIRLLNQLEETLNNGSTNPDSIPVKVSSAKDWDAIPAMA